MPVVSSYSDVLARVTAAVTPVGTEQIPLLFSHGRVLAQDVISRDNVPPFDKSPYDGYSFRSADAASASAEAPVTLRILEEIAAGSVPHFEVTEGTAVKILTGAPVPPGADAVVPFEYTKFTAEQVTVFSPIAPGSNVIKAGEDIRKGELLVKAGSYIDAGVIASLAAQNIPAPLVYRRPKVGILSTGSELTDVGTELAPGKIYDSNGYSLTSVISDNCCCEPLYYGNVKDDLPSITAAVEKALSECDAVITTGGVSVGDYDLVPAALAELGAEIFCRKIDVKPGMACCYGTKGGKLICGLSGNPASAISNFNLIALPAMRKLAGLSDYENHEILVTLATDYPKSSPNNRLLRGRLDLSDGTVKMVINPSQGNIVISSMIGCDVEAIIPAGSGPVPAGTQLRAFRLKR